MWQTEIVRLIRHMVNDLETPPTYTDDRLEELVLVAAQLVLTDAPTLGYKADVDQLTLTPDPTIESSRDQNFIGLLCLKAACVLDMSEARKAATQAISIRDGSSAIDLRGALQGKMNFMKDGWCKLYQEAITGYLSSGSDSSMNAAIMTPFTIMSSRGAYARYGRY